MILPNPKTKSNAQATLPTGLDFFHDYQAIFENLNVPILVADENLDIIVVNQQYEKLAGYSRQELIGKNIIDIIIIPENKQLLTKYHQQRMLDPTSVPSEYEIVIVDKNGNDQYLLLNESLA